MNLENLKFLVKDQFPEFYQAEFPQFIEFVKQYYNYLDTTAAAKFYSVKDIDSSLDEFIIYLKEDFAKNVPQFGHLGDREFLRFAKEFYASRGSEDSYRFLFRAMYGKEIEIFYPASVILKASDGRWEQEVSLKVQVTNGNPQSLVNKVVKIVDAGGSDLSVRILKTKYLSDDYQEFFIDRLYTGAISVGSTLYTDDFSGIVVPTASVIQVIQPGQNFVEGYYFEATYLGETLRFRVREVTSGALYKVEIIQNAGSFTEDIYCVISPGVITSTNVGTTLPTGIPSTSAILKITTSEILKYPGFYSSPNGFPSSEIKIQDNDYYQTFSYVLKLDEQFDSYKSIVKRLLQPAGVALWGQFDITQDIRITPQLISAIRDFLLLVEDNITTSYVDSRHTEKNITDYLQDTPSTTYVDYRHTEKNFIDYLQDTKTTTYIDPKHVEKNLIDYLRDTSTTVYVDSRHTEKNLIDSQRDTTTTSESLPRHTEKNLIDELKDTTTTSESLPRHTEKNLISTEQDTTTTSEIHPKVVEKSLTAASQDTISVSVAVGNHTTKPFTDSIGMTEGLVESITKGVAENITYTETLSEVFEKGYTETVGFAETGSLNNIKGQDYMVDNTYFVNVWPDVYAIGISDSRTW